MEELNKIEENLNITLLGLSPEIREIIFWPYDYQNLPNVEVLIEQFECLLSLMKTSKHFYKEILYLRKFDDRLFCAFLELNYAESFLNSRLELRRFLVRIALIQDFQPLFQSLFYNDNQLFVSAVHYGAIDIIKFLLKEPPIPATLEDFFEIKEIAKQHASELMLNGISITQLPKVKYLSAYKNVSSKVQNNFYTYKSFEIFSTKLEEVAMAYFQKLTMERKYQEINIRQLFYINSNFVCGLLDLLCEPSLLDEASQTHAELRKHLNSSLSLDKKMILARFLINRGVKPILCELFHPGIQALLMQQNRKSKFIAKLMSIESRLPDDYKLLHIMISHIKSFFENHQAMSSIEFIYKWLVTYCNKYQYDPFIALARSIIAAPFYYRIAFYNSLTSEKQILFLFVKYVDNAIELCPTLLAAKNLIVHGVSLDNSLLEKEPLLMPVKQSMKKQSCYISQLSYNGTFFEANRAEALFTVCELQLAETEEKWRKTGQKLVDKEEKHRKQTRDGYGVSQSSVSYRFEPTSSYNMGGGGG